MILKKETIEKKNEENNKLLKDINHLMKENFKANVQIVMYKLESRKQIVMNCQGLNQN